MAKRKLSTKTAVALVWGVPIRIKAAVVALKSKLPGTAWSLREATFYDQLKKAAQVSESRNAESKLAVTASKPSIPTTPGVASKRKLSKTTVVVVALVIMGLALSVTTLAALTNQTQVLSTGVVTKSPNVLSNGAVSTSANCGVYSDSGCTIPLSSIDWGNLTAGGTVTQTIYIKNTSSGLPLTLNMTTTHWSPASANGPITVTWNQEGTILSPGQSTVATLTLTVSSSEVGITDFSVQISITGTNP
jgi:hypothetical protein